MVFFTINFMASEMTFQIKTQETAPTPAVALEAITVIRNIIETHTPCGYVSSAFYKKYGTSSNTLIYLNYVLKDIMSSVKPEDFNNQEQETIKEIATTLINTIKNPVKAEEYHQAIALCIFSSNT